VCCNPSLTRRFYIYFLHVAQLDVVSEGHVKVDDGAHRITVSFTPTVPHCSMATLIGLSIRVKLLRVLPRRFKVDVVVSPGKAVQVESS
jgi:metal-sulfur cluster biosynthetic enzyme